MTTNDITVHHLSKLGFSSDIEGDYVTYEDHVKAVEKARDDALEDYAAMKTIAYNAGYYQSECGLPAQTDIDYLWKAHALVEDDITDMCGYTTKEINNEPE